MGWLQLTLLGWMIWLHWNPIAAAAVWTLAVLVLLGHIVDCATDSAPLQRLKRLEKEVEALKRKGA